jgi:hypothetical protein
MVPSRHLTAIVLPKLIDCHPMFSLTFVPVLLTTLVRAFSGRREAPLGTHQL